MNMLNSFLNFFKNKAAVGKSSLSPNQYSAHKLSRVMKSLEFQSELMNKGTHQLKSRNVAALRGYRVSLRKIKIPNAFVAGHRDNVALWWTDEEVIKKDIPENIPANSPNLILLNEKVEPLTLLNGTKIKLVRQVVFDIKDQKRAKNFWVLNEEEKRIKFTSIPKKLLPLHGISLVEIKRENPVILTEGGNPAAYLRDNNFIAVGTLTGALVAPSDIALQPLLKAQTIYLWPDNDRVGAQHMNKTAFRLNSMGAKDIRIVKWIDGPRKGDAADFSENVDEIKKLLADATRWSRDIPISSNGVVQLKVTKTDVGLRLKPGSKTPPARLSSVPKSTFVESLEKMIRKIEGGHQLSETEKELLSLLNDSQVNN